MLGAPQGRRTPLRYALAPGYPLAAALRRFPTTSASETQKRVAWSHIENQIWDSADLGALFAQRLDTFRSFKGGIISRCFSQVSCAKKLLGSI